MDGRARFRLVLECSCYCLLPWNYFGGFSKCLNCFTFLHVFTNLGNLFHFSHTLTGKKSFSQLEPGWGEFDTEGVGGQSGTNAAAFNGSVQCEPSC